MKNNEVDYMSFLDDFLSKQNPTKTPEPTLPNKKVIEVENDFLPPTSKKEINVKESVISSFNYNLSEYEEIIITDLPMGFMYPTGTCMLLRACTYKEIQDFSTYDKSNPFDFRNKLDDIIENCVIFKNSDGTLSPFQKIMDGDRMWLIYMIREKTFPKGRTLTVKVDYIENNEKKETLIEIRRENIDVWRNDEIMIYFDDEKKVFIFETILRNDSYIIAPPTLGLRNCFLQYLEIKNKNKTIKNNDAPFYKIAPYLKPYITSMTYEELETYQHWFENNLNVDEYSLLTDLIDNHLKIGIRGLKKNMGESVLRTNKILPDQYSAIFIVPNAFELFTRKSKNVS